MCRELLFKLLLFLSKVLNKYWSVFLMGRISSHFIKQKAKNTNKGV